MASVLTQYPTYATGPAMSFPIVMKSPYRDWHDLIVRVKVKTAAELFIGALCEQADSGTFGVVEKTADESEIVYGIVLDTVANKKQLSIDNSGVAPTKLLFFAANSYIDILPLIPGFIVSVRQTASVCALDCGTHVCADVNGAVRLEDDAAKDDVIGRIVGNQTTNGTGVQYLAMAVI